MIEVTIKKTAEGVADFDLPEGCLVCGGDVAVRLTPHGARSCCVQCHLLSKPELDFGRSGLSVAFPAGGDA